MGQAAAVGIDPSRILRADPTELEVLVAVAKHAHEYHEHRDRTLARMVVRELSDALKRGRSGR